MFSSIVSVCAIALFIISATMPKRVMKSTDVSAVPANVDVSVIISPHSCYC